ncbi:hypothetical protein [Brevundimonas sp.]|uniref:hypothetical protein n=1 Tax=Brevundimonas sp. TaxID=1871086 RepID=UPI0035B33988
MLSALKPLLCRHDYFWSERHRAERCRRCGRVRRTETTAVPDRSLAAPISSGERGPLTASQPPRQPSAPGRELRREAAGRRERLLVLLDALATRDQPSREDAIDAVLAIIEDAHSPDPVLFGPRAAAEFARLREARSAPGSFGSPSPADG